MYENIDCKYNKFWVPLMWANSVLVKARKEGLIQNEWGLRMIIEVCNLPILIMFFINRLCFLNCYIIHLFKNVIYVWILILLAFVYMLFQSLEFEDYCVH